MLKIQVRIVFGAVLRRQGGDPAQTGPRSRGTTTRRRTRLGGRQWQEREAGTVAERIDRDRDRDDGDEFDVGVLAQTGVPQTEKPSLTQSARIGADAMDCLNGGRGQRGLSSHPKW